MNTVIFLMFASIAAGIAWATWRWRAPVSLLYVAGFGTLFISQRYYDGGELEQTLAGLAVVSLILHMLFRFDGIRRSTGERQDAERHALIWGMVGIASLGMYWFTTDASGTWSGTCSGRRSGSAPPCRSSPSTACSGAIRSRFRAALARPQCRVASSPPSPSC